MYIYLVSSEVFRKMNLVKIGLSENPYSRLATYRTGCPPGLTPSHDLEYDGLWETTATTTEELYNYEEEIHDHFLKYRKMRSVPGDSEWFQFHTNAYEIVSDYMKTRSWVKCEVSIKDIPKCSRHMKKQYHKNLAFLKTRPSRNDILDRIQQPVIESIRQFLKGSQRAGVVIAPCGSGKTKMTASACTELKKIIICCPSKQIQLQWKQTMSQESSLVGGSGTTDPHELRRLLSQETYCIITTYMSSHLLVDLLPSDVGCIILDEAHHMAGVISKEETGAGRTRRLMVKATELNLKRLSLTYTPRFVQGESDYLTMDDTTMFGSKIAELKIRDLIRKGVLPDYRLWTLRDEAKKGTGVIGKAECLLEAWNATEIVRGKEQYILHHLIVFASTIQDAKELERFFTSKTKDTILRVEEGDKLEGPLRTFETSERAMIINCFVLNEGVDIPCANAVAIMYPKQSRGQITQMILRAGRWYEGKPVFHVLIPTVEDDDLSGFEEVLSALASCDEHIRDEIVLRSSSRTESEGKESTSSTLDTVPECIMIDVAEANEEDIRRCFMNIRKNLFPSRESKRIQDLCLEKGWDTSVLYHAHRSEYELPEDPRPKHHSWYDYLHPRKEKMTPSLFGQVLSIHELWNADTYDEWRKGDPCRKEYPSVQHINDGYFGDEHTDFNTFRYKYASTPRKRR